MDITNDSEYLQAVQDMEKEMKHTNGGEKLEALCSAIEIYEKKNPKRCKQLRKQLQSKQKN